MGHNWLHLRAPHLVDSRELVHGLEVGPGEAVRIRLVFNPLHRHCEIVRWRTTCKRVLQQYEVGRKMAEKALVQPELFGIMRD